MVGLLYSKADFLNEICINLTGSKGIDHVVRHGVVLENSIRNPIPDKVFIKDSCLYSDVSSVQVLDSLELPV